MAHKVEVKVPYREVGRADVEFVVKSGNTKIGTLKISKGGVVWSSRQTWYGKRMSWKKFDSIMSKYSKIKEKN